MIKMMDSFKKSCSEHAMGTDFFFFPSEHRFYLYSQIPIQNINCLGNSQVLYSHLICIISFLKHCLCQILNCVCQQAERVNALSWLTDCLKSHLKYSFFNWSCPLQKRRVSSADGLAVNNLCVSLDFSNGLQMLLWGRNLPMLFGESNCFSLTISKISPVKICN